jgi:hypothetical protein
MILSYAPNWIKIYDRKGFVAQSDTICLPWNIWLRYSTKKEHSSLFCKNNNGKMGTYHLEFKNKIYVKRSFDLEELNYATQKATDRASKTFLKSTNLLIFLITFWKSF